MRKYAYSSVVQDNLWDALTEQAHLDGTLDRNLTVKEIMDTWTLQKGLPLLTVTRSGNQLYLKQNLFTSVVRNNSTTSNHDNEKNISRWFIGFTYTTKQELKWNTQTIPIWFRPDQLDCKNNNYRN